MFSLCDLIVMFSLRFLALSSNSAAVYTYVCVFSALQRNGFSKNLGLGERIDYENELIAKAMPELIGNIQKGEEFVQKNPPK